MAEKTYTVYECDIDGVEGERYTITFPDGVLTLDRCAKHAQMLEKLREEKGMWHAKSEPIRDRRSFKVSTLDDIREQME